MTDLVCPACGTSYAPWVARCATCGLALVSIADDLDLSELPEDDQVVYELGVWPLDLQARAAEVLAESGLPHRYDGTDVIIHVDHEAQVDALLEEVEREGLLDGSIDSDGTVDDEQLVYDLSEWNDAQRDALAERLDAGGVPHEWEDTDLAVAAADEELVEELIAGLEYPDQLEVVEQPAEEEADDAARWQQLNLLFLAADRLKGNNDDEGALADLAAVFEEADPARPPYGVDRRVWELALTSAGELESALAAEENDVERDVVAVTAKAAELRDLLRPYL